MPSRLGRIVTEITGNYVTRTFDSPALRGSVPANIRGVASGHETNDARRENRGKAGAESPAAGPLVLAAALVPLFFGKPLWARARPLLDILPAPSLVLATLMSDRAILFPALAVTLGTTLEALALAIVGGVALACAPVCAIEMGRQRALLPVAIVLQVTPIIAIAPLLLSIYLDARAAVLACAFLPSPFSRSSRIQRLASPPSTTTSSISLRFTAPRAGERCSCSAPAGGPALFFLAAFASAAASR